MSNMVYSTQRLYNTIYLSEICRSFQGSSWRCYCIFDREDLILFPFMFYEPKPIFSLSKNKLYFISWWFTPVSHSFYSLNYKFQDFHKWVDKTMVSLWISLIFFILIHNEHDSVFIQKRDHLFYKSLNFGRIWQDIIIRLILTLYYVPPRPIFSY